MGPNNPGEEGGGSVQVAKEQGSGLNQCLLGCGRLHTGATPSPEEDGVYQRSPEYEPWQEPGPSRLVKVVRLVGTVPEKNRGAYTHLRCQLVGQGEPGLGGG